MKKLKEERQKFSKEKKEELDKLKNETGEVKADKEKRYLPPQPHPSIDH